jgi:ophiobolin F synthase
LTKEFLTPALIAASLVNDLFSFEKEKNDANCQNAVYIVMKEHGCSEKEGRERIKQRIRIETANYVQIVKDTKLRTDISEEVKRYVDVMQYTLSGNVVWSAQCPRYNLKAQWNELQMLRATHGVAKYPATWPPADGSMDHLWKPKGEKRKRNDSVAGTNGMNGTNGVKKSAISKLSTDSLNLTEVVSLALDFSLPGLSDHVSCVPFPDFCQTINMPQRL